MLNFDINDLKYISEKVYLPLFLSIYLAGKMIYTLVALLVSGIGWFRIQIALIS